MARYVLGSPLHAGRLGVLPAAFNPPTVAHLVLADAAAEVGALNQVVFTLPENLPHKTFEGATLEQRIQMLQAAINGKPGRAVAVTSGGLFIEIAREFRALCGADVQIFLICGCDAADRIVSWDYGAGPDFSRQLDEFSMLVGSRGRRYEPPEQYVSRIQTFDLPDEYAEVSSTAARNREPDATPAAVARLIERYALYQDV